MEMLVKVEFSKNYFRDAKTLSEDERFRKFTVAEVGAENCIINPVRVPNSKREWIGTTGQTSCVPNFSSWSLDCLWYNRAIIEDECSDGVFIWRVTQ